MERSSQEYVENNPVEQIIFDIENQNLTQDQMEQIVSALEKRIDIMKEGQEDVTPTSSESNSEMKEKEEELNHFGLPNDWAKKTSLDGLERIRQALSGYEVVTSSAINPVLNEFLLEAKSEYKKYRGEGSKFDIREKINDNRSQLEYLKLNKEGRLAYLEEKYSPGLKIMDTNKHLKWSEIADYDLWAIQHHSQSLTTLDSRGGLGPKEIMSIIFGVDFYDLDKFTDEAIMKWFENRKMLVD